MDRYDEDFEPAFKELAQVLQVPLSDFDYNRKGLVMVAVDRLKWLKELNRGLQDTSRAIGKILTDR